MTQQQEEQFKLKRQSGKQAIALALQGQWEAAVAVNRSILETSPNDVDAYNRLGRAYMELGDYQQAKEAYGRALKIDSHNTIAKKNLERLSLLREDAVLTEAPAAAVRPEHFIEEVGKSGTVNLYLLAPQETIATLVAGDKVYLRGEQAKLVVENGQGKYIGLVDPKQAQRLIKLMNGGNRYSAAISATSRDAVSVLIREEYQDPSQLGQLSFPPKGTRVLRPFIRTKTQRPELEFEEEVEAEVEEPAEERLELEEENENE
ncbi:MAG: tetratricopeptide repeat protein [Chloroflexi bacterium]|nr:tetratricopeptide repeat protein [Chloroflexota bacterium]